VSSDEKREQGSFTEIARFDKELYELIVAKDKQVSAMRRTLDAVNKKFTRK
jgi:hypothetical protein